MNVKIVDHFGAEKALTTAGSKGVLTPYINKITQESDPMVVFPSGRFLHVDTIRQNGCKLIDLETNHPV